MKIAVAGGPGCGKTTFARQFSTPHVWSTDELVLPFGRDTWSEQSAEVAEWFNLPGPWVIEGVTVVRALRKWVKAHPSGRPCDVVYWRDVPLKPLNSRQQSMLKGCQTIWFDLVPFLERVGVEIKY